jgi:hypothetical protein
VKDVLNSSETAIVLTAIKYFAKAVKIRSMQFPPIDSMKGKMN